MRVLVTGGAGYIGSHTCLALLRAGHEVTVVDDLRNARREALDRVEKLAGRRLTFHQLNVCDGNRLDQVFAEAPIDCVIHFAGLKAVGESVEKPQEYYQNNLMSTLTLCRVMTRHGVGRFIFSSSATVYAPGSEMPVDESAPLAAPIPTAGPSSWGSRSSGTSPMPPPAFPACCCAISTPSALTLQATSGRTPAASPTT